jgi:hypothetical protein
MMERRRDQFYSRSLGKWMTIEEDLMHPSLTGRDIDPYHYETRNYLLFPYQLAGDDSRLIPPEKMAMEYPEAWAYLNHSENRAALEDRDKGAFRNRDDWYGYGRPQNMHLLGLEKIVGPDVAVRAEFACDFEGRYIIDTVYAIRLKAGTEISLLALATLLNSSVMTFFLQQTGTQLRGGYFRMKTAYLNPFPIPHIDFTTSTDTVQRYAGKCRQLYEQFRTQNDHASVRGFVVQQIEANRTDIVHNLLAHLASRMIEMHKDRQEHQRIFRLDLSGYLDEKQMRRLNRLYTPRKPPKEGVKNYERRLATYEEAVQLAQAQLGTLAEETLNLEEFWRLNQGQWMWLLRQNLGNVADMSMLVGVYEQYRQRLAPLMRCIQRTDWLIDQVVYLLYGLTDEEIAAVEGK